MVKELLVSYEHLGNWFVNSDPSKEGAPLIAIRPWMNFKSRDPHMTLLEKYQRAVESFILTHPGITMVRQGLPR